MKLKLIHILNKLDGEREINSINSLSKLKDLGVDYIQQITPLYEGDEWQTNKPLTNYPHGKGHYGNYLSFKKAIKENFTEDIDALILCECDCVLNISYENVLSELQKTLNFCEKYNVYHFSWGGNIVGGVEQGFVAKTDENYPDYCIVNKITMAHFIILTKQSRDFYLNIIDKIGWDGVDIWLNELIYSGFTEPGKQATIFNKLAYQYEGLSLIDNFVKGEKIKNEMKKNKLSVVMYCTENYYETSINLIKTLNIFHNNFNIYLYEINFNTNPNIDNVNIINLEDDRIGNISFNNNKNDVNNTNMFRAIFIKSKVVLHSLKELKLDEVLFLDSDLLSTKDITSLFEYFKQIKNYPLIQKGPAEYLMINGKGSPFTENGGFDPTRILEYPIMNKLGIPIENRTYYSITPIILYNANCLEFIEEYDHLNESTFNLNLEEIKYLYPFADETTINILLWKYKYNDRLPFLQVNINNINEVNEFYYSNYEFEKKYSTFTKIPSKLDKPNKIFFHGVKNNMSTETSNFIRNFYLNNKNFNIICDKNDNKIHISCNSEIEVKILIYEWYPINNSTQLLYETNTTFNNNRFWYATSKQLKDLKGTKVEIKYNNRILKEEYFKTNVKKQVLVLHSEVGIGDNLASTPTIKKISEIYDQKVILLTYIPSAFINNPYVETIVKIDNNSLQNILSNYNSNDYKINNLFVMINLNWRLIDHKQLCAYNCGFQLKQNELDMQFYPDPFEPIENLPEKFICINPSETEPERTWGYENWQKFIDLIQEHIPVVAIGKETYLDPNKTKKFSNIEIKNGLNLLNHPSQNTLSQAYHIISKSETFITMNNGLYILSLCNLDNHITELQTAWNTTFYRTRKGVENYNLDYIRGVCDVECLANPKISVDLIGSMELLKSGNCYLNKSTYECHPTPEQVYESVLKIIKK